MNSNWSKYVPQQRYASPDWLVWTSRPYWQSVLIRLDSPHEPEINDHLAGEHLCIDSDRRLRACAISVLFCSILPVLVLHPTTSSAFSTLSRCSTYSVSAPSFTVSKPEAPEGCCDSRQTDMTSSGLSLPQRRRHSVRRPFPRSKYVDSHPNKRLSPNAKP